MIAGVGAGLFEDYQQPILSAIRVKQELQADRERGAEYEPYAEAYLRVIDALHDVYRLGIYTG